MSTTDRPRIAPVPPAQWSERQIEVMGDLIKPDGYAPNVITTFVRHPELCQAWLGLSRLLLRKGSLPEHDRELMILRIAWRRQSVYEWRQHAPRVDEKTLDGLTDSSTLDHWSEVEQVLIDVVDEFCESEQVSETNWTQLERLYDDEQLLEVVFICSMYRALASMIHVLGILPDTEYPELPPLHEVVDPEFPLSATPET